MTFVKVLPDLIEAERTPSPFSNAVAIALFVVKRVARQGVPSADAVVPIKISSAAKMVFFIANSPIFEH